MSRCSTKRVSWEEWKQRCAIGNCDAEARDDLGNYGGKVIAGLWKKFSGNLSDPFGSHRDRWHLFESYMHACSTRTGKRWKDWLFEKASGSSDDFVLVLEKEAYECMDTTVRKYCRAESHRKARLAGVRITSSDEPISEFLAVIHDVRRGLRRQSVGGTRPTGRLERASRNCASRGGGAFLDSGSTRKNSPARQTPWNFPCRGCCRKGWQEKGSRYSTHSIERKLAKPADNACWTNTPRRTRVLSKRWWLWPRKRWLMPAFDGDIRKVLRIQSSLCNEAE
jgi:hypothetical protein